MEGVQEYESEIQRTIHAGKRIRAMVLCHPHNPLGRCYTTETLIAMMKLCDKYAIHLLVDEIYALSVYHIPNDPKAVAFKSILSFDTDQYIRPTYLHHLYGTSKDAAAGGIRLGCLYTRNSDLMKAVRSINQFHWSGNVHEKIATLMLENFEWQDSFLSHSRHKLAERNMMCRGLLEKHGIDYRQGSNAGFFLWIDLRPWLPTVAADEDPWKAEDELTQKLFKAKVFITSGKELSAECPGFYRFIFTQEGDVVTEALRRYVSLFPVMRMLTNASIVEVTQHKTVQVI